VLSVALDDAPDWLVASVPDAVETFVASGGQVVVAPAPTPVARLAVVTDPSATPSCCSTCPRAAL
jgi:hypothetical protein